LRRSADFFRLQTIGARLACRFGDGLELLAVIAVMRIGLSLESSDLVGVDFGGAP
jgi:hypothetical protein